MTAFDYNAFISYAHRSEHEIARSLKAGLEQFARAPTLRRSMRLFVDAAILVPSGSVWEQIEAALVASEFLILLASPVSARSEWVHKEVAYWLEHRRIGTLLIVVTEGDIRWNSSLSTFDKSTTNCLPPSLLDAYAEEPLYLDIRHGLTHDENSGATSYWSVVATLASVILKRPKDELVSYDLELHRYAEAENLTLRAELSDLAGDPLQALLLLVESYRKNNRFDVLKKILYFHNRLNGSLVWEVESPVEARFLVLSDSGNLLIGTAADGNSRIVSLDARNGSVQFDVPCGSLGFSRPRHSAARGQYLYFSTEEETGHPDLPRAAGDPEYPMLHRFNGRISRMHLATHAIELLAQTTFSGLADVSADGGRILCNWMAGVTVHRLLDGVTIHPQPLFQRVVLGLDAHTSINEARFSRSGRFLIFCTGQDDHLDDGTNWLGVHDLDGEEAFDVGDQNGNPIFTKQVNSMDISPDETHLVGAAGDGKIAIVDRRTGEIVREWNAKGQHIHCVRYLASGKFIVTTSDEEIALWSVATGKLQKAIGTGGKFLVCDPEVDRFWSVGERVCCIDLRNTQRMSTIRTKDAKPVGMLSFHVAAGMAAAVSRSDSYSQAIGIEIFDSKGGQHIASLRPGADDFHLNSCEWSPSGKYLAMHTTLIGLKEDSETTWRVNGSAFTIFGIATGRALGRWERRFAEKNGSSLANCASFCFVNEDDCLAVVAGGEISIISMNSMDILATYGVKHAIKMVASNERDMLAVVSNQKLILLKVEALRCPLENPAIGVQLLREFPLPFEKGMERFSLFMHFDLSRPLIYLSDTLQPRYIVALDGTSCREVTATDVRAWNSLHYFLKCRPSPQPREKLPLPDPAMYCDDHAFVLAMRNELLHPIPGVSAQAEELLESVVRRTLGEAFHRITRAPSELVGDRWLESYPWGQV